MRVLGLDKGYWVMVTVLVVLKPGLLLTQRQTALRVVGTLLGALLGLAGIVTTHSDGVRLGWVFVFCAVGMAMIRANYGAGVVFLTPMVLVLLGIGDPESWQVAEARVVDTLLGAALGLAGALVLWRGSERQRLRDRLARCFRDLATGLRASATADRSSHRSTREQLARSLDDAELSHRRFLAEPVRGRGRTAAASAELLAHLASAAEALPGVAALGDAAGGTSPGLHSACGALAAVADRIAAQLDGVGPASPHAADPSEP